MIQVAGDRDMASQETAHMLLSLLLVGCTFSFVTISLDNSRKVNLGNKEEGKKTKAIKYLKNLHYKNIYAECKH
jgi:hypothetical protein